MTDAVKPLACPNPECDGTDLFTAAWDSASFGQAARWKYHVVCTKCGYQGPYSSKEHEAIRLHNLICTPPAGWKQIEALQEMEARKDAAYLERNRVVAALAKCFPSGVAKTAIDGWSEDWHGCVYIDLPTGQVSWHFHDSQAYLFAGLPPYTKSWDGHTTEEKYQRVAMLSAAPENEP